MQSFSWYMRRLTAMSPGEILWRARSVARDRMDRHFLPRHQRRAEVLVGGGEALDAPGFSVSSVALGAWGNAGVGSDLSGAAQDLRIRADAAAKHRVRLFDLDDFDLGRPICWNRDTKHAVVTPMDYAQNVDYRDFRVVGDCKFVWEPNRHQHLVVLARACRALGERRYADEALDQLSGWMDQCPFGRGMNWRSPLELAIRLINWVWVLDLIRPSVALPTELKRRLATCIYLHVWDISRKFSKGSSANNHLIGEAAGVYIASRYLPCLPGSKKRGDEARAILCREILSQTFADGCTREQAFGYHLFVLQFLTLAQAVAREVGEQMPSSFEQRLRQMYGFLGVMLEGGSLPMVGDSDDGYVLDLDCDPLDPVPWMELGKRLLGEPAAVPRPGEECTAHHWVPGGAALGCAPSEARQAATLTSHAMPASGYYLLQSGRAESEDRISVLFDCGELGYGSIAAHGHADALSFTLRVGGIDVIVDPGTYDYFTHLRWRSYFRGTQAHNTVLIDDSHQSEMLGLFLWGRRAEARCIDWQSAPEFSQVVAEHNGYARLPDPVTHRRRLKLEPESGTLWIHDTFEAAGPHRYVFCLHFAETCTLRRAAGSQLVVDVGERPMLLELDPKLEVQIYRGSEDPIAGWVSRGYHRRTPAATVMGRVEHSGPLSLTTSMRMVLPDGVGSAERGIDEAVCREGACGRGVELHEEKV